MKRISTEVISRRSAAAAGYLAGSIRAARQARGLSQVDLAERARISVPTVSRLEGGHPGIALWVWLSVMEVLGMLEIFEKLRDPKTEALARAKIDRPIRKKKSSVNLDF